MSGVFTMQDRQDALEYVISVASECDRVVALVQVGSGAVGFRDERSDLDFVVALDKGVSMAETMDLMHRQIAGRYEVLYVGRDEARHLQCFVLSNFLEIDIGYGGYENAAAWKPAFKVLFDRSGTVEEKMVQSRSWMDDKIFGDKQQKDIATARSSVWLRLMHAATAIHRGNFFRAIGELEYVRKLYIDLLGDRYRLESSLNREIDRLPEAEKAAIRSTFVTGESREELVSALQNLTELVYRELADIEMPITKQMLYDYYKGIV